jgi:hypothetical protein
MIPDNLREARTLMDRVLERQSRPSEDGRLLTKALLDFAEQTLRDERFKNVPKVMIRYMAGEQIANTLGLVKTHSWLGIILIFFMRILFGYIEKLEDMHEPVHNIMDRISTNLMRFLVNYFNDYKKESFRIPEHLQQKWGVQHEL